MSCVRAGILTVVLLGCAAPFDAEPTSEDSAHASDEPEQPPFNPVYERLKWFEGLEEWVLVHKSPSSYHCVRADGRIQRCPDVEREDEAEYYRKWGHLSKSMVALLAATPEDREVEARVMFDVDYPAGLHDRNAEVKQRAREQLFANILTMGDFWQDWVEDAGGTITSPTLKSMPLFMMKARPSIYRILARSPGIGSIGPRTRGMVGHF
jgi:hypothetical protein